MTADLASAGVNSVGVITGLIVNCKVLSANYTIPASAAFVSVHQMSPPLIVVADI